MRLLIFVCLTMVAIGIAWYLQRRRPDPPSAPSYRAPTQLDRADFMHSDEDVLIVVFASQTCDSCPRVWAEVAPLASEGLVVCQRIDVQDNSELHTRYKIDGVPTTVVSDSEGVVSQTFFGAVTQSEVADAVAQITTA